MQFTNLQELQNITTKFSTKEFKNLQELAMAINTTRQEFLDVILKNILAEISTHQDQLRKKAPHFLTKDNKETQEKLAALHSLQNEIKTLQNEIRKKNPASIVIEEEKKLRHFFKKMLIIYYPKKWINLKIFWKKIYQMP